MAAPRPPRERAHLPATPAAGFERQAYEHLGQHLVLALPILAAAPLHAPGLGALAADAERGGLILCGAHVGLWELPRRRAAPSGRRAGSTGSSSTGRCTTPLSIAGRAAARAAGMPLVADHGSAPALRRALDAAASSACCPTSGRRAAVTVDFSAGPRPLALALPRCAARPALPSGLSRSCSTTTPPARRCSASASSSSRRAATAGAFKADDSLTQSYADALGATIAEFPAQYFWWHRRWKAA